LHFPHRPSCDRLESTDQQSRKKLKSKSKGAINQLFKQTIY